MDEGNKTNEQNAVPMSRRYFLEIVGGGAIGVVGVGSAVLTVQYLSPNVLHEPSLRFKAGLVQDFPPESVTLIANQKSYVVRATEGYFYAMSAICTHLGCITNWKSDESVIVCPCHGSKFDTQGNVIAGPAPGALPRYSIVLEDKGHLVVDKRNTVSQDLILKV